MPGLSTKLVNYNFTSKLLNLVLSKQSVLGDFLLVDFIITELKNHMTWLNSIPLIGWNYSIQTGEQIGFFIQINFPPIRAFEFITGHVIFKLPYNQIY